MRSKETLQKPALMPPTDTTVLRDVATSNWSQCSPSRHRHGTVFRVLGLANAAVWSGPLIMVLGQGQRPNARTRRRLAARSFRLLQAAVIIAVLRNILQVLHRVGGGEGHAPMGVLETERQQMNTFDTEQVFHLR